MKFLVYDPNFNPETAAPPSPELMEEMGKFIAEAQQAGVVVDVIGDPALDLADLAGVLGEQHGAEQRLLEGVVLGERGAQLGELEREVAQRIVRRPDGLRQLGAAGEARAEGGLYALRLGTCAEEPSPRMAR